MIEYEIESAIRNSSNPKDNKFFNIIKDKIKTVYNYQSIQAKIASRCAKIFFGITGLLIFCGIMVSFPDNINFLLSMLFSLFSAAILTPLIGCFILLTMILLFREEIEFKKINSFFSKKYRKAFHDENTIRKELATMLSDPLVQYEIIHYLQTLNAEHKNEIIEVNINELVGNLAENDYDIASKFVIENFQYWLDLKEKSIQIVHKSTTREEFLKSLNLPNKDNREKQLDINSNLKSML